MNYLTEIKLKKDIQFKVPIIVEATSTHEAARRRYEAISMLNKENVLQIRVTPQRPTQVFDVIHETYFVVKESE